MSKPLFCRHRWQILRQGLYPPPAGAITKPMLIHILQPLRHILVVQRLDMLQWQIDEIAAARLKEAEETE